MQINIKILGESMKSLLVQEKLQKILNELLVVRNFINSKTANSMDKSTINLTHYLNLRSLDLVELQNSLTDVGLSSLGRSQSNVLNALNKDIYILSKLLDNEIDVGFEDELLIGSNEAFEKMIENAQVFGANMDAQFKTKVMVTLPSEACENYDLVEDLVVGGVNVFRINTAHDNPDVWQKMAQNIKRANETTNKDTKIYVDLAGPKNRTGPIKLTATKSKESKKKIIMLPKKIKLCIDDEIIIAKNQLEGDSDFKYEGKVYKVVISCTNKEIFDFVQIGHRVFIDDGKIECVVTKMVGLGIVCKVLIAKDGGATLKSEKGLNFPDTSIDIDAITKEDEANLLAVINFADIVGVSFVQDKKDIKTIQDILEAHNKPEIAIVPKIETKMAVENMPQILMQLLKSKHKGIMIARGDLAIEVGFERLAYIQEELFAICESAHVPVIYATQILENKMKTNIPSRAEITDAAFAQRADCVMLNKGPFVVQTVKILKNILKSMHTIFQKNKQLLSTCNAFRSISN